MRITYDDLVQCGVDEERCEAFARRWPTGMEVTAETAREAVGMRVSLEWLARDLMRPVALRAYDDATDQALRTYDEATDQALRAYREATYQARRAYREEIAPAERAYEEATDQAARAYQEACILAFVEAAQIHDQEVGRG